VSGAFGRADEGRLNRPAKNISTSERAMPFELGTLRIKDLCFPVTDATLSGKLYSSKLMEWFLSIETRETQIDNESFSAKAYLEKFPSNAKSMDQFVAEPIVIKDGGEFCDRKILPACRLCCLYVWEHHFLDDNRIQLERWGTDLKMIWTAKCTVRLNEEYGDNLPMKITTVVEFTGLWLEAENKRAATKLLANVFDDKGFKIHKEPGHEGIYLLPVPLE
jgi:hypothetical protein